MASNSPQRLRPLNVGGVVSAGLSLWRTHFKTYLGLSAKAVLWYLVPIYGWARCLMIRAQIGRLSFQEVIHKPESVAASLRQVQPRMWTFLGIAILVGLIQVAVNYAVSIAGTALILPMSAIGGAGEAATVLSGLLVFVVQLVILAVQMWVQARFWLYDMILAMETDIESTAAITRSWELTKGHAVRVLFVLLVSYLVMLPLFILTMVPFLFTIPFFPAIETEFDPTFVYAILLALLAFLVLLMIVAVVTIPFWQAIKAVLYYDLRSRREGFDIQLRDRPNTP